MNICSTTNDNKLIDHLIMFNLSRIIIINSLNNQIRNNILFNLIQIYLSILVYININKSNRKLVRKN